jgi:hypothetical protein
MGMDSMVDENKEESLPIRIFGVPVDRAIAIIQAVGIPTVFMFFICYLAWSYVPTVASAHIRLLERTGDTLEKMDETLRQSNLMLKEVADSEKEQQRFMDDVKVAHDKAQRTLDEVESVIIKKELTNGNN